MIDQDSAQSFQFAGQDLPWLLDLWTATRPDHPLLIWEPKDGQERRWTYREFNEEITALAAGLHARGVRKGEKVLIHADNCPEMVLAWYACAKLGAVAVTTGEFAHRFSHNARTDKSSLFSIQEHQRHGVTPVAHPAPSGCWPFLALDLAPKCCFPFRSRLRDGVLHFFHKTAELFDRLSLFLVLLLCGVALF